MFKAYFDDSTSDENNQVLVLAGCVQSIRVWSAFNLAWESALAQHPRIRHFHMREARKLQGEFLRWKAHDRDEKIKLLASVAERFRPWTISAWVSRKEHDLILKPIAPYMIRHAYGALFGALIVKLACWHHARGIKQPVEYVFDEQGSTGHDAALWYRHIKSWQNPEVAALMGEIPTFENDEMVLPLQAADMLAWHIRRRKENPNEQLSALPTATLENLDYAEIHLTRDFLIDTAKKMDRVPHVDTVRQKPHSKTEFRDFVRQIPTDEEYDRQKSKLEK